MNIIEVLRKEEVKLRRQLEGIQGALAALHIDGSAPARSKGKSTAVKSVRVKRTMSAALRAKLSQKAKERWAKIRAEKGKGKKAK